MFVLPMVLLAVPVPVFFLCAPRCLNSFLFWLVSTDAGHQRQRRAQQDHHPGRVWRGRGDHAVHLRVRLLGRQPEERPDAARGAARTPPVWHGKVRD